MLLHILEYYYSAAADYYSGANPSAAAVAVALKFESLEFEQQQHKHKHGKAVCCQ
jgi:hypothetical protein